MAEVVTDVAELLEATERPDRAERPCELRSEFPGQGGLAMRMVEGRESFKDCGFRALFVGGPEFTPFWAG